MKPFGEAIKALEHREGRAMNFIFALQILYNGRKLYRLSWKKRNTFLFMEDGIIFMNKPCYKGQVKFKNAYPFMMTFDDIYSEDWFIY